MGFISIKKSEGSEGMNRSQLLDIAQKVYNDHDFVEEEQNKRIAPSNRGAQGDGQKTAETEVRVTWKGWGSHCLLQKGIRRRDAPEA